MFIPAIPVFDVGRIAEWILKVAKWTFLWFAVRAFFLSLFVTVIPMVIYSAWNKIQGYISGAIDGLVPTSGMWQGVMIQYSGMAAWMADRLLLPACISVLLAGLGVRFVLSFIRR